MKSRSPVGAQLDLTIQASRVLARKSDEDRTRITADLRRVQAVFDEAATQAEQASANKELTQLGKRRAIERALTQARTALAEHAAVVATMERDWTALRAEAMKTPPAERSVENLLLEREVRDAYRGRDALEIFPDYLNAVERGDWIVVRALENGPFQMLRLDQLEAGAARKMFKSPLAAEVTDGLEVLGLYRSTVKTAETELSKLAEAFGVRADADPEV
jgi:hypothetical protein